MPRCTSLLELRKYLGKRYIILSSITKILTHYINKFKMLSGNATRNSHESIYANGIIVNFFCFLYFVFVPTT